MIDPNPALVNRKQPTVAIIATLLSVIIFLSGIWLVTVFATTPSGEVFSPSALSVVTPLVVAIPLIVLILSMCLLPISVGAVRSGNKKPLSMLALLVSSAIIIASIYLLSQFL